VIHAMNARF